MGPRSGSEHTGPIVGPVLAAAAVTAALVLAVPDHEHREVPPLDPEGFVAAYERSRTEELFVDGTFTRTLNDGRQLQYERLVIQRPPDDDLVVGAGSASGRLDGHIVRCNVEAEGEPANCIQGPEARPYDEQVADEVEAMRSLVAGAYEAERVGDGCWDLILRVAMLSPPYGGAARFCFDEASGAVRYLEVRRAEGIDVLEAVEIRTEVTDADLAPSSLGTPIATG